MTLLLAMVAGWLALRGHGGPEQGESFRAVAAETQAEAAAIVPHRALYDLHLIDARSDSGINNAGGRMLFSWGDSCDGWLIEQRLDLAFSYSQQAGQQRIRTSLASWEAKDGSDFRFAVHRDVNGKDKETFAGQAQLAALKLPGALAASQDQATYTQPTGKVTPLDAQTLFPTLHTLALLRAAKAGQRILTRDVFDGADEDGRNDITAVIGAARDVPALPGQPALTGGRGWPVQLAFYNAKNVTGEPDYELSMLLLENGVAQSLTINYGDFTVGATLHAIEPLPKPAC